MTDLDDEIKRIDRSIKRYDRLIKEYDIALISLISAAVIGAILMIVMGVRSNG